MNPEEFRAAAHRAVDWMADYLETIENRPVRAQVQPGEVLAKLPDLPPENGEPIDALFADLDDVILPGMTHWQHPSFFAYFPANSSPETTRSESRPSEDTSPSHSISRERPARNGHCHSGG